MKRRVSGSERDSVCFDGGVHAGRSVRLLRRRVRRVGLAISAPDGFTALKILLVVVFLWLASPVASHLLCRLEVETNEERGQYMNVHEQSLAQEREEAARAKEEQA